MEEIKAYKLSNGEIIEDVEKAKDMQKDLDCRVKVKKVIERSYYDGISSIGIVNMIIENRKELIDVLI